MTLNRTETMKDHSQYENFQAAMVFALHALGNIVKNFTTPDQVRGEYYTGYQLGDQGAGQDYVVGVLHRVFGQGAQVFQFKPLRKGDVILANEARLSHHFMRNNWEGTVADQQLVLQTGARQQNLLDAASLLGYTHGAVETNTIYHMGQADKDETMKVIHSGSMIIAPEDINADIQNFIDTMVADTGGQASKSMHRFLQNKIRQVATLNRSGRKGNIDPRTNALGGPMMTSRLGSSIDLDALQAGNVEAGYYADWLALSGSMDLTPAQAMRGGSAFAYDMMGYGGMLGSSGARASMGAGYGSAGLFDDSILEGSFERSTMSEQFVTGGTISSMADGNTSQEQKDWALNHSGNPLYVKDKNNAVSLDSHGSARMRFTGQQNTAAKQMLLRGLGGGARAETRNSVSKFLATSDAAARGMGASMASGSGWQQWAKGMGPENKYYAEGEYKSKSRKAGWGEAGVPQLWAAPYVSIYYPAKQARVAER